MSQVSGTFLGREALESGADDRPHLVDGSAGGGAKDGFEFGINLFDGIEVGAVGRKGGHARAARFDRLPDTRNLVHTHIIHDHDVTAAQRRRQHLLDVGAEALAVHGAVQQQWRGDPIMAQGGDEGHRLPAAERHFADQALAARRPTVAAHQVRGDGSLIDKDKPPRVKPPLLSAPGAPRRGDVGPILLGRVQDFF